MSSPSRVLWGTQSNLLCLFDWPRVNRIWFLQNVQRVVEYFKTLVVTSLSIQTKESNKPTCLIEFSFLFLRGLFNSSSSSLIKIYTFLFLFVFYLIGSISIVVCECREPIKAGSVIVFFLSLTYTFLLVLLIRLLRNIALSFQSSVESEKETKEAAFVVFFSFFS